MHDAMKDEIYQSIKVLLQNDNMVSDEQRQLILKSCRQVTAKGKLRLGTVRQVAELLGCHVKTVQRYAQKGCIHPIKHSLRRVRYDMAEIEAFVAKGLSGASSAISSLPGA